MGSTVRDDAGRRPLQATLTPGAFVLGLDENGYGIVRSLAREGIGTAGTYSRSEDFGRFSRYCRAYYLDPSIRSDEETCDLLIRWSARLPGPPVLFATSDEYVSFVVRNAQRLSSHFLYHWVPLDQLRLIVDKSQIAQVCEAEGVAIPRTYVTQSGECLEAHIEDIPFPCLVKPNRSFNNGFPAGMKNLVARRPEDLLAFYQSNPELRGMTICQEIIEGEDANVIQCTLLVRQSGEPGPSLCVRKIRQYPPGYGLMSFGRSETNHTIDSLAFRIVGSLNYRGLAELEFKYRPTDEKYYFLEMNPRLPLYNILIATAGLNLAHLAYLDLVGKDPFGARRRSGRSGVYWICLDFDIGWFLSSRGSEHVTSLRWLRSIAKARSFAWWDWRDLRPFLREMLDLLRRACRLLFGRTGSLWAAREGDR